MSQLETTCSKDIEQDLPHIGTLRRLKNFLPAHVRRTVYNNLLRPHFHYSIAMLGFKMGRLKRLQKRAIRVITCNNYNAHTEPLLKKLNILSLSDILTLNTLKTHYNHKNDKLPVYVTNMFSAFSRAHAHDTRLDIIPEEPHSQTDGGELCIRHLLHKTINDFDSDLIGMVVSHSYQSFVSNVKKKISHYVNHCSTPIVTPATEIKKKLEQRNFVMNLH